MDTKKTSMVYDAVTKLCEMIDENRDKLGFENDEFEVILGCAVGEFAKMTALREWQNGGETIGRIFVSAFNYLDSSPIVEYTRAAQAARNKTRNHGCKK